MLEKTQGAMKSGQSREIDNVILRTHDTGRRQTEQKNTRQKTKLMSNQNTGGEHRSPWMANNFKFRGMIWPTKSSKNISGTMLSWTLYILYLIFVTQTQKNYRKCHKQRLTQCDIIHLSEWLLFNVQWAKWIFNFLFLFWRHSKILIPIQSHTDNICCPFKYQLSICFSTCAM